VSGTDRPLRVVALGGGHGLGATLRALRRLSGSLPGGLDITAVVTVADNGGSSGRLRREFPILPPGDLRMAMASLLDLPAADPGAPGSDWTGLLQHRLASTGPLAGHALGNLMLTAAWEHTGDAVAGLDLLGGLLGVPGRVLPMCPVPLDIVADVEASDGAAETNPDRPPAVEGGSGQVVRMRGQAQVAVATGRIRRVWLEPSEPPACPAAVAAIRAADWVLLGPGSWFTSVLPHLLVPELRDAITTGPGRVVLALNLDPGTGETAAYPPAEHLTLLRDHAPQLAPVVVLADEEAAGPPNSPEYAGLAAAAGAAGARLVTAPLAERNQLSGRLEARHDPDRLAAALAGVLSEPGDPTSSEHQPALDKADSPDVAGFRPCR